MNACKIKNNLGVFLFFNKITQIKEINIYEQSNEL